MLCSHLFSKVFGVEICSLFHSPGSHGYHGMHCEVHPSGSVQEILAPTNLNVLQVWAGFLQCCVMVLGILSSSRIYELKGNIELELTLPTQVALDLGQ